MSSPRVLEKEKNARRCLAEIAIFDSVDLKTLKTEELQRFLFLAHEYSAHSADPDLEKSFSKLVAVYNISPNLTQKIEEVIHHKIAANPENAMEYFEMLKRQEMEAMMQAKFEQYTKSLVEFKHSVDKVYSTAERFDNSVASIAKNIFGVGASKEEIKKALSSIYATNPVLAQAIIAEYYKGKDIPKEYVGFFYTPQQLAQSIGGKTLDSKTVDAFKKVYNSNPVATVQAIEEAYTKKGLPIPAELLPFSKLPDGFSVSTGNIFVGPIRVSGASISQATVLQHELEETVWAAANVAKKTDDLAKGAKVPTDKQLENVLGSTPKQDCTGGSACVIAHAHEDPRCPKSPGPAGQCVEGLGADGRERLKNLINRADTSVLNANKTDSAKLDAAMNEGASDQQTSNKNVNPPKRMQGVDPSQTSINAKDYGLNYGDGLDVLPDEGDAPLQRDAVARLDMNKVVSATQDASRSMDHVVQLGGLNVPQELSGLSGGEAFAVQETMSADTISGGSVDEQAMADLASFVNEDLDNYGSQGSEAEQAVPALVYGDDPNELDAQSGLEMTTAGDGVYVFTSSLDPNGVAHNDLKEDFTLPMEEAVEPPHTNEIEVSSVLKNVALVVDDTTQSGRMNDVLRDSQQTQPTAPLLDKTRDV